MIPKVIIIFIALMASPIFGQAEKVVISEKKTGKRVVLMAENETSDTLSVFLTVNSEGYRRSADKPVLKSIPPHTKLPMITLIELANVESKYTFELLVNEKGKFDNLDHGKGVVDIENLVRDKIVVFTLSRCEKCELLTRRLTKDRITYNSYDIAKDPLLYRQFMRFIESELTTTSRIEFPIIWNKDHTLFGYEQLEQVMTLLVQ